MSPWSTLLRIVSCWVVMSTLTPAMFVAPWLGSRMEMVPQTGEPVSLPAEREYDQVMVAPPVLAPARGSETTTGVGVGTRLGLLAALLMSAWQRETLIKPRTMVFVPGAIGWAMTIESGPIAWT